MEHHVKTKHGVSKETYKQEPGDNRLAGEIQGKADPACLWNVESQTLLKAHKFMHEGIVLPNADGSRRIEKNNDAFVDDTNGTASKKGPTHKASATATVQHLQKGSQLWLELVCGTGGSIAFHRSLWTMVQHEDTCPPKLKTNPDGKI